MKRMLFLLLVLGTLTATVVPAFGETSVIWGCYKKQNGQLRIVGDTSECHPSELPICWNTTISWNFSGLMMYVSASGMDGPGRGLSPDKPLRTIQYALNSVTPLRLIPDIHVTIVVSPGIYEEAISVNNHRVWLQGAGSGSTFLRNSSAGDVVAINGARDVVISGFTVQGGFRGIYARRAATFEVRDTIVCDSADRGIQIDENSSGTLSNCTVQRCLSDGIFVMRSSSATLAGTTTSSDNKGRGMLVNMSSVAVFVKGSVGEFDNNFGRGVHVDDASSLFLNNSTVRANMNKEDGVAVYGSSKLSINFASTVTCNGNRNGLFAGGSSSVFMEPQSTLTLQNNTTDGLLLISNAQADLRGRLTANDNGWRGILCSESSAARIDGVTLLQGNGYSAPQEHAALQVTRGSHARVSNRISILGNKVTGLAVYKGSSFELEPGSATDILIQGNSLDGIRVMFNSQVSSDVAGMPPGTIRVIGNGRSGVFIDQNSAFSVRGGATITGHSSGPDWPGLKVLRNSQLVMHDSDIMGNGGGGLLMDDSTVELHLCDVTGNGQGSGQPDIRAYFGSRISLPNSTIGSLNCDNSSLCRGSGLCPR